LRKVNNSGGGLHLARQSRTGFRCVDKFRYREDTGDWEVLLLDDALNRLAEMDARRSQVVELRYFGGLNNEEIAGVLKISENTVTRDWNMARAWLYQELSGSVA